MSLRMPRWDLLDKNEQMPVINFPLNQGLWVQGGPGTGKTILALYRAHQCVTASGNSAANVHLLTFSKSLTTYIAEALRETSVAGVAASTWHQWLYRKYWSAFSERVPEVGKYKPDWSVVTPKLVQHFEQCGPMFDYLLIDEAQDLPAQLLKVLRTAARSITVFSDPNQRIHDGVVEHEDIGPLLGLTANRYYLTRNYRNTFEIAAVADSLIGTSANAVRPPLRRGRRPAVLRTPDDETAFDYIANYLTNNPDLLVGVLCYSYPSTSTAFEELAVRAPRGSVQMYSNRAEDFDLTRTGAKVMTFHSSKGLEFDTVFVPLLQRSVELGEQEAIQKNRAYVAATRARDELYFVFPERPASKIYDRLSSKKEQLDWKELGRAPKPVPARATASTLDVDEEFPPEEDLPF